MKKVLILVFVLLALLAAGIVLTLAGAFTPARQVSVVEVQLASLNRNINTNGKIEADRTFQIRAPVAGVCNLISAREGDLLKKGDEILRVDDPSLPSELASARAELESALVDLRNVRRGPAPEELSRAQADVAGARLEVEQARELLKGNEWLLQRQAISKFEVEQSRRKLAQAEQALAAAIRNEEELKKRYGKPDLQQASARVDAAQARIRYLEGRIAQSVVRAPADGTLYQFSIESGAYLNTGDLIGLLADLSHLRLRAFVDEPDFGQVKLGEKVKISWDAHPDQEWTGVVTHLPAQVVALGSRSVAEVLCSVDNPEGTLIPNINVDVEIMSPEGPKVPSLPREVVFPDGNREFVWIVKDGRAEREFIETGRSTVDRIEVTGGLRPGAEVIDPGDILIGPGMKVRVEP